MKKRAQSSPTRVIFTFDNNWMPKRYYIIKELVDKIIDPKSCYDIFYKCSEKYFLYFCISYIPIN